jgi:hypothetical protein
MNTMNWVLLGITGGLAIAGLCFLLACLWYDELEGGGWSDD